MGRARELRPTPLLLGLRLHLVCTLHGLPIAYALTGAKAEERNVLTDLTAATPALAAGVRTISADNQHRRWVEVVRSQYSR